MEFYDLYVPSKEIEDVAELAEKLGFSGIGIAHSYEGGGNLDGFLEEVKKHGEKSDVDLITCCDIDPESTDALKKIVGKVRQKVEVVVVRGGEFDINKASVRDSRVDILLHPEYRRKDSGLDHKTARSASMNDVAVGLVLHPLLQTYGKLRSHILGHMRNIFKLSDKYEFPIVTTSGAKESLDMRDPRELASIARCLDVNQRKAMDTVSSVPSRILEDNRKKLEGKMGKGGVEVEEL